MNLNLSDRGKEHVEKASLTSVQSNQSPSVLRGVRGAMALGNSLLCKPAVLMAG